jgi:hypothetical protein
MNLQLVLSSGFHLRILLRMPSNRQELFRISVKLERRLPNPVSPHKD